MHIVLIVGRISSSNEETDGIGYGSAPILCANSRFIDDSNIFARISDPNPKKQIHLQQ